MDEIGQASFANNALYNQRDYQKRIAQCAFADTKMPHGPWIGDLQ
jgi:hypothetical protein